MEKLEIPVSLKTTYAIHKGKFTAGMREWDFDQQLRIFSNDLNKYLQKENKPKEKMDNPTNFTTSDLHEQLYVFLFGTSQYAEDSELTQMENVEVNLEQLYEIFTKEQGLEEKNIRSFPNETGDDIKHELCSFLEEIPKKSTLIFYFAGHGVLGENQKLYFTTPKSRTKTIQGTGISASSIREIISDSRADRKVVILDCCFSGAFTDKMASAEQSVRLQIKEFAEKIKGSFIMTSSAQTKTSKFDSKNPNRPTYFTEALIQTLREGIDNNKNFLTTSDIYEHVKYLYSQSEIDLPKPTSRSDNEGDEIIMAINRYYKDAREETNEEVKAPTNSNSTKQSFNEPKKEESMIDKNQLKEDLSEDINLFFEKMMKLLESSPEKQNSLIQKKNKMKRLRREYKDEFITKETHDTGYTKIERYLLEMIDELN